MSLLSSKIFCSFSRNCSSVKYAFNLKASIVNNQQQRYLSNSPVTFLNRRREEIPGQEVVKPRLDLIRSEGSDPADQAVYILNQRLAEGKIDESILKAVLSTDNHIFLPLGTRLISLYIMESFQERYPYLPGAVLSDLSKYYLLPRVLGKISENFGLNTFRKSIDDEKNTTATTSFCSFVGLLSRSVEESQFQRFMKGAFDSSIRKLNIKSFINNPLATDVLNKLIVDPEYRYVMLVNNNNNNSILSKALL